MPDGGPIVVRSLDAEDWQALRAIRLRALADAPDAFGSTLEREASRPDEAWRDWAGRRDRVVVLAERDGAAVGIASGGPAPTEERVAGLYAMWVEPSARGSGVAERLVDTVEAWAREAGYREIGLGVTVGNDRAARLYERLGYRDTGARMPLREGSPLEIRIMVKRIAPDGHEDAGGTP